MGRESKQGQMDVGLAQCDFNRAGGKGSQDPGFADKTISRNDIARMVPVRHTSEHVEAGLPLQSLAAKESQGRATEKGRQRQVRQQVAGRGR